MFAFHSFGRNYKNTIIRANHSQLERASEDSPYRSKCPVCKEGLLLVTRIRTAEGLFPLHRFDRCTWCCQGVIYEDADIAGEVLPPLAPDFIEKVYAVQNGTAKVTEV